MRYFKNFRIPIIFFLIAFPLFIFAARDTFQDDRPNDTTSAYYAMEEISTVIQSPLQNFSISIWSDLKVSRCLAMARLPFTVTIRLSLLGQLP